MEPENEWLKTVRNSYRSALHLSFCLPPIIIFVYATDMDLPYRIGTFLTIGSFGFLTVSVRLGATRCFEYKSLLQALESKLLVDRLYHQSIKTKHNSSHPDIFLATSGHPMKTTMRTISGDVFELISKGKGLDKREAEEMRPVLESSDKILPPTPKIVMDYYSTLFGSIWFCCLACAISIVLLLSNMMLYADDSWMLALNTVHFVATFLIMSGEAPITFIFILRWLLVTECSIQAWGYQVVELITASDVALEKERDAAMERNADAMELQRTRQIAERVFTRKIDALHDLFAIPLATINQKISTVITFLIPCCMCVLSAQIAELYSNLTTTADTILKPLMMTAMIFMVFIVTYNCGQLSENLIQAKESLRRPRVLLSLNSIFGDPQAAEFFTRQYMLYEAVGFKLISVIFTHGTALTLIATFSVGMVFAFGPSLANAMV